MRFPTLAMVVFVSASASRCASTGGVPEPFPKPGERPATPAPAVIGTSGNVTSVDGYALTGTALGLRGSPYRNGGIDPAGFDCSGFISYVFAQHGVAVPRTVEDLYRAASEIGSGDIQPGDLVFFAMSGSGPSHVGLALGGDEFIHAPSSPGVVRVERLSARYWTQRFVGARRISR